METTHTVHHVKYENFMFTMEIFNIYKKKKFKYE